LYKSTRRKITCDRAQKCLQYIYYIFIACARSDLLPSSYKIKSFSKLRYVLGARLVNLLYGKLVQFNF